MAANYGTEKIFNLSVYKTHLVSLLEKIAYNKLLKRKIHRQTDRQTLTVHSYKTKEIDNFSPVQL